MDQRLSQHLNVTFTIEMYIMKFLLVAFLPSVCSYTTSLSGTGGGFQDDSLKRKSVSSTSTVLSHPKKLKVEETIAMAVSEMASSIKEMASSMVSTTSKKANVTVDEVYEEMMTIPDLEEDLRWSAIEVFANNVTKFQILKKIPLEKKSEFVLKSMSRDF